MDAVDVEAQLAVGVDRADNMVGPVSRSTVVPVTVMFDSPTMRAVKLATPVSLSMNNTKSRMNCGLVPPIWWVCPAISDRLVPYLPVLTHASMLSGVEGSVPVLITTPSASPSSDTAPSPSAISDPVADGVPFQSPS